MNWPLLKNSLIVSSGATVLSVTMGLLAALWLSALPGRWRNRLLAVSVLALALPPFLVTNCWLHFFGYAGVFTAGLQWNLYSFGGIPGTILILALMTWPITLVAVLGAWRRLEPAQLESDPMLNGGALLRWLLLPVARPALAQAAVLTFVLALNNFAVPAILQVKVFPAELWVRFSTTFDYASATVLSWPMVLAPVLLWLWLRRREVEWPRVQGPVSHTLFRRQLGRPWLTLAACVTFAVLVLSVGLPLAQLTGSARTWTELPKAWSAAPGPIWNSFYFAAVTATLAVGAGLLGWRLRTGGILWLTFLVPGVLWGIALIYLLNRPVLSSIYQSAAVVVIGLAVHYLAPGWYGVAHAMRSTDPNLADAARLEGASGWQLFRLVQWPQVAPQVASAWYVVYLLCLWDVETLVLIVPPGGETVALRVFNLLHYGHNAHVNALCLLLLALALGPLVIWNLGWVIGGGHCVEQPSPTPRNESTRGSSNRFVCLLALFPLAPALSLGERENSRQSVKETDAVGVILRKTSQFPLPRGAGEGEGKRGVRLVGVFTQLCRKFLHSSPRVRMMFVSGAMAAMTGCAPGTSPSKSARIESRIFSHVEIIGSRGTGVGEFNKPRSVAVDRDNNLYVVDMTGRVQKFSPDGRFLLLWQMPQTDLGKPKGLCRDAGGNIIVIEPHYSRINHHAPDGRLAAQWGDHGNDDGQLMFPRAAAVNSKGEIWVSEYGATERVQRFVDQKSEAGGQRSETLPSPLPSPPAGERVPEGRVRGIAPQFLMSIGKAGDGPGDFNRPEGLGVDSADRLYVADSCNHRIQVFTPDGQFLRAYGKAGTGLGELSYPYDIRIDSEGRQYVCEFGNSRIQVFDANDQPLEIIGGTGSTPGRFANPWSIALDSHGNLYVADSQNHRVQKFIQTPKSRVQGPKSLKARTVLGLWTLDFGLWPLDR